VDYKTILAPFVGVFVAWLASKGIALTGDQVAGLTALAAGGLTFAAHYLHSKAQAPINQQGTPPHA
jgi:uncharacterized membrane protein (DUF441 family)